MFRFLCQELQTIMSCGLYCCYSVTFASTLWSHLLPPCLWRKSKMLHRRRLQRHQKDKMEKVTTWAVGFLPLRLRATCIPAPPFLPNWECEQVLERKFGMKLSDHTVSPQVREVKWSEVKWSEVKWSDVKWCEVKWSEVKWCEVRWSEVKWSEVKWSEVKWSDVRWGEVRWGEVRWGEVKWSEVKWSEVKWSEVKWSEVKWSEVKWSEVKW